MQAGAQNRSNFILAATALVAACDVVEEADAGGVSKISWQRELRLADGAALLSKGALLGGCDTPPPALPSLLPCSSVLAPGCSCPVPQKHRPLSFVTILGARCQQQDGVVNKEIAGRFN